MSSHSSLHIPQSNLNSRISSFRGSCLYWAPHDAWRFWIFIPRLQLVQKPFCLVILSTPCWQRLDYLHDPLVQIIAVIYPCLWQNRNSPIRPSTVYGRHFSGGQISYYILRYVQLLILISLTRRLGFNDLSCIYPHVPYFVNNLFPLGFWWIIHRLKLSDLLSQLITGDLNGARNLVSGHESLKGSPASLLTLSSNLHLNIQTTVLCFSIK